MSQPSDSMSTFLAGLINQSDSRCATILIVDNAKSHQHVSSKSPATKNIVRRDIQKTKSKKKQNRTKRDDGVANPCRWDENQGGSSPVLPARRFGKNRDNFIENVTHLLNLTENRSQGEGHKRPTKNDPKGSALSTWPKRDAILPPTQPVRYGCPEKRLSSLMHHDPAITGPRYI